MDATLARRRALTKFPLAPFPPKRRKLGPTELRGRRDRLYLASQVLTWLATMPPTPDAGELAARAGWTVAELMPVLGMMERASMVELWKDPDQPGLVRVMLSAASLANLGLHLSPRGDRWDRFHSDPPGPSARSLRT